MEGLRNKVYDLGLEGKLIEELGVLLFLANEFPEFGHQSHEIELRLV